MSLIFLSNIFYASGESSLPDSSDALFADHANNMKLLESIVCTKKQFNSH